MKTDREKLVYHKRAGALIGLAGIVFASMTANAGNAALAYLGLAVFAGGIIYMAIHLRCPHCGKSFHIRTAIPDYCPHCGKKIE